jgi:pyrimidine-specific ribonucleoside hydrolase
MAPGMHHGRGDGVTVSYRRPVAIPVILDVDTGVDDAYALLFAAMHPGLDLRAVTCVAGNVDVDQVVVNTATVLAAAGAPDVPIGRGADRPLLAAARSARHVHGHDGLGDLGWPPAPVGSVPAAIDLLRTTLRAADEPVTVVTLAPMTNIALLLRAYPEVISSIERIVFMGGSALAGNATAAAEFNIWHDPESAAVVLDAAAQADLAVTMYGLDVFYGPSLDAAQADALDGDTPARRLAAALMRFSLGRYADQSRATIGDAGAVCAVVDPHALTTQRMPVRVELAGAWTRGQTVVDRRTTRSDLENDEHGLAPAMVDVALAVDADRYRRLWSATVAGVELD